MDGEEKPEILLLRKTLDAKNQELYSANMQVNRLLANVTHLETENGELRNELDEKGRDIDHMKEINQSQANKISSITLQLKAAIEEKETAQLETEQVEADLKLMSGTKKDSLSNSSLSFSTSFGDAKTTAFHEALAELEEEKEAAKTKLSEAVSELQRYMDENTELRQENSELREEIECIQYQLSSQCDINERLRQEVQDLRLEPDSDAVPVAAERKGNSLFSEVEDRRIKAEKCTVKMQRKVESLEENLIKEVKENERLKARLRQLRQAANRGHNEESVQSLSHQLEESKKKVAELTEKLQSAEKHQTRRKKETISSQLQVPENASEDDKRFCGYIEGLVTQSKQEAERERSEHEHTKLQLLHTDLLLTRKSNELIAITMERDRLKGRNCDLSVLVRDLQRKYEPECHNAHKQGHDLAEETLPSGSKAQPAKCLQPSKGNSTTGGSLPASTPLKAGGLAPTTTVSDKSNKENEPGCNQPGTGDQRLFPPPPCVGRSGKTVGMREAVTIVAEDGSRSTEELKRTDGGGHTKLAKNGGKGSSGGSGGGTGKYNSINCATDVLEMDSADQCKQQ